MILDFLKNKRKVLMKSFLGFLTIMFIMVMVNCVPAQTESNYRVSWDMDATGKTASWNVYLEQQPTNTGFTLVPGVNRENTVLDPYTGRYNRSYCNIN